MSDGAHTLAQLAGEACRAGAPLLGHAEVQRLLALLPDWEARGDHVEKTFRFRNYHETMAFVNAVAWIAHRQDHHPDLQVGFNRCVVAFGTHDAGGITRNDCVSAARVEQLQG